MELVADGRGVEVGPRPTATAVRFLGVTMECVGQRSGGQCGSSSDLHPDRLHQRGLHVVVLQAAELVLQLREPPADLVERALGYNGANEATR